MSGGNLLASNESREVFRLGERAYTVRDTIDAAQFRGELEPAWQNLLRLVAAENHANAEDREIDEAAIDAAAQAFRYDYDLITAEETERWLAERELTLDAFGDYFIRHYWGEALGDIPAEPIPYATAPAELRELCLAELTLSGELNRMATQLSWRLAVSVTSDDGPPGPELVAVQRQQFLDRLAPLTLAEWIAASGRDEEWIDRMSVLEANFRIVCERVVTPQARQRELGTLRLPLTVLDVETIEFDSNDAAREALFCVRDDGIAMEAIAAEGRYPFRREELVLEDIAPEIQQQFLSITAGELLEPIEADGSFRLYRVLAKREPDPADSTVRFRIEQRLLDRHFADLVNQHVRWEIFPSQSE